MPSKMSRGVPPKFDATQKFFETVQRAQQMGPDAIINELSKQYPQAAHQIQAIMQSGQNPMELAFNLIRQQGGNPEIIMSMLSSMHK